MRPTALGFLLPLLLLPAPAHAADYPLPTEQELGHAIEAVHGPCGHVDGPWRLSNLLLALVPWDATYEFTAPLVECNDTEPRPLSANGRLFEWLAIYADDPQRALEYAQITDTSHREPAAVRRAAVHLLSAVYAPEEPEPVIQVLRGDPDQDVRKLARSVADGTYIDPYQRGLGAGLDYEGALLQTIFIELKILNLCDCPAQPRGTPEEQRWANFFLALHPETGTVSLPLTASHPLVERHLETFWTAEDPLQKAMAAVVIWRLAGANPSENAASAP